MPTSERPAPPVPPTRRPSWWGSVRVVVRDESMRPTLRPGDRLWVDRRAYRGQPPRFGDLVVLRDPEAPARWLVKRIAAVGPDGRLTVASDDPSVGRDSRTFGPVTIDAVVGRVYRRYFPAERRGEL